MKQLTLHFGGFYESIHSDQIENTLSHLEDENEPNYPEIYKNYSRDYLEKLTSYIKDEYSITLDLNFDSIDSPREYNFRTDYIILNTPSLKEIRKLSAQLLMEGKLAEKISYSTMPSSGYHPFYTSEQVYANKDNTLFELTLEILAEEFNEKGELPYEFI